MFLKSDKSSWNKVEEISNFVNDWNDRSKSDGQIIALCEAINETKDLNLSEPEIRQRIAQHAWDEFIAKIPYAKVRNDVLTTVDEFEIEKQQLLVALKGPLWDKNDRKTAGIDFKKYKGQMKKGRYELTLKKAFTFLYECAKGNIPPRKSAIDILKAQEAIFKGLYDENAFDLE